MSSTHNIRPCWPRRTPGNWLRTSFCRRQQRHLTTATATLQTPRVLLRDLCIFGRSAGTTARQAYDQHDRGTKDRWWDRVQRWLMNITRLHATHTSCFHVVHQGHPLLRSGNKQKPSSSERFSPLLKGGSDVRIDSESLSPAVVALRAAGCGHHALPSSNCASLERVQIPAECLAYSDTMGLLARLAMNKYCTVKY